MHFWLFIIHLISATIWVGGHLMLCIQYLPDALRKKDPGIILNFEKKYEPVGLPALAALVITGIMMAYQYGVPASKWFSFAETVEKVVSLKLILLFATVLLAVHARAFIIPRLSTSNLKSMAFHIILITIVAISMLLAGSLVRFGGL